MIHVLAEAERNTNSAAADRTACVSGGITLNKKSPVVRICALGTVIFLFLIYIGTLIAVIADVDYSDRLLKASLILTIIMPTLIYGLNIVMNVLSGKYDVPKDKYIFPKDDDDSENDKSDVPK